MNFTISKPQKKRKAQPGAEAAFAAAYAIGAAICLYGQTRVLNNSDLLGSRFNDYR
jgi:hypothetical protein